MSRFVQSLSIVVGGGLLLATANLFIPSLAIAIGFFTSLLAVMRIFFSPGVLSWRRDANLFLVLALMLLFAWLAKWTVCVSLLPHQVICNKDHFRGDVFGNTFAMMLPVMLFWSWVRFRLLRDKIMGREKEK